MAPKVPITVRLNDDDMEVLDLIASSRRTTRAELGRDVIIEGMEKLLEPVRIEAEIEAEKLRQHEQARKLREQLKKREQ
jgi:hypothetical protein